MGLVWRLNFISPSSKVDVVSKNTFLELDMSTVNLIELWKELAKVMKSFRQSRFSTHFISISSMNRNQLNKYIGVRGSHFGAHSCTTYLYVMFAIKHEIVQLENMFKELE